MKKKWLGLILSLIFIAFSFMTTTAGRISSWQTIYLDPGHGGTDGGAMQDGIKESTLTLSIALCIKEILEEHHFRVLLTRTEDSSLCDKEFIKKEDMSKRVAQINQSDAALALSIHLNHFGIAKYRGAQVFYSNANAGNEILAKTIQNHLRYYLGNTDREVVLRDNIFILNRITIPCCIVECGFMSNPEEFRLLQTADYRYQFAQAILYSIQDYLKVY